MKSKTAKPKVFTHASFVLVRRPDNEVDVCDPLTNVWTSFKTERHAKWSATVFSNLSLKFGHRQPEPELVQYVQSVAQAAQSSEGAAA